MDVVMLCKEWVHSASLSQQPLVILPESYIKVLERAQLTTLGRKELSKKECEEFLGSYFLTSKLKKTWFIRIDSNSIQGSFGRQRMWKLSRGT